MKQLTLLAVLMLCATLLPAQTDTLHINGTTFIAKTQATPLTEFEKHDTLIKLYRVENGNLKYLLQHTRYSYEADCNNEFVTKGWYLVQNDSIVFKTTIKQKTGLDPIADAEEQVYRVSADGKLRLISDKEHIDQQWKNKE